LFSLNTIKLLFGSKNWGIFAGLEKVSIHIEKEEVVLLAHKCVYWPSIKGLVISDLHFGKSSHFRKSGIALSAGVQNQDLRKMDELIAEFQPEKLIFLGDLFHSGYNMEWDQFCEWRNNHSTLEFILILGNHDLLSLDSYQNAKMQVIESLMIGNICLSHEPIETKGGYNVHGHVHPGIKLVGKAYQSLRIPCFHIGREVMVLPAFGNLTGLYTIEPKHEETIYGIANLNLIKFEPT
jgi:DNA ligase-associated metallophosphoesterase